MTVTYLSAMCVMSLSFSQFRIFSPINNNIGGGKVHVQLDDDEKPAGRRRAEGRVAVGARERRGAGCAGGLAVLIIATYVAALAFNFTPARFRGSYLRISSIPSRNLETRAC